MSWRTLGTSGIALLTLLAFPSASHASIWDWIWSMSGPQLMGPVFHCEYDWEHNDPSRSFVECRASDRRVTPTGLQPRPMRRTWLTFDTGFYFSTGKNADEDGTEIDFKAFDYYMVAFEPMIEIRGYTSAGENFMLHHGLFGATYGVLFGSGFDAFDKAGLKFRPIGVTGWKKVNAAFNLRWYPHGFTADEFGFGPRQTDLDRDGEWTWGFSVGYLW